MAYRDNILQGRFRDVPFFCDDHEQIGGERLVVHEFPLRTKPYTQSLGPRARQFSVPAYVLGDDVDVQRDKLLAALDVGGPGVLIHPWLGTITVEVLEFRQSERSQAGRQATFNITFSISGQDLAPTPQTNSREAVKQQSAVVQQASEQNFAQKFSIKTRPEFIATSITAKLNSVTTQLENAVLFATETGDKINKVKRDLTAFTGAINSLLLAPAKLAVDLGALISAVKSVVITAPLAVDLLNQLFTFGLNDTPVPRNTGNRITQSNGLGATNRLVQLSAIANAAVAMTNITFATRTQGDNMLQLFVSNIDRIIDTPNANGSPIDDNVYESLKTLKAYITRDILARSAGLPSDITITIKQTIPALVLSHQLYLSIDQADNIVSSNAIKHPGFIPGGSNVKVAANAA